MLYCWLKVLNLWIIFFYMIYWSLCDTQTLICCWSNLDNHFLCKEWSFTLEGNVILLNVSELIPGDFLPMVCKLCMNSDMICSCSLLMGHVTCCPISKSLSKRKSKGFFFPPFFPIFAWIKSGLVWDKLRYLWKNPDNEQYFLFSSLGTWYSMGLILSWTTVW